MKHKKVWAAMSAGLALLTGGIFATRAFAYTVDSGLSKYGYIVKQSGVYTLVEGDSVKVTSGGIYRTLNGQTIHISQEQATGIAPSGAPDGQGSWGLMQADMAGANANNGYLLIAAPSESTNVQSWVQRLGGNLAHVDNFLQSNNQLISTQDYTNGSTYTYVPFASVVTQSGGKFGKRTAVATGQTIQGNPVYKFTYPILESAQPKALAISVSDGSTLASGTVMQGDPIAFTAQSGVYLWSGEAAYHYDAVQITDNATGQSVWAVGTGNTDRTQMMAASGGGVGTYTDYPQSGGTGTLPEYPTANLQPGTYTAKFWVADGVDRISATPATTTFTIAPASATPTPPPPTPAPSGPASITLSPATSQSVASGTSETIQYTTTNFQPGDHVEIVPSGSNTSDTWSTNNDTQSSDTFNETENPQNGSSSQVQYTAYLYNSAGTVIDTAQSGQITWTSSIPATTSLTLAAKPTTVVVGNPTTLTVVVPPNPTGGAAPNGEFLEIINQATGQAIGLGAYTGSPEITYGFDSAGETETYTTTYTSNNAGSQTFLAELWDPGVTPYNHPPNLTSNTVTVNWIQPTIALSASPANPLSGQPSQLSYSTVGMASGDYVTITGAGGKDMWSESKDTQTSGTYTETENPTNGGVTTVQYTGDMYTSSGTLLSKSTLTVTWTAPTITMTANPAKNVPGQTSTLSYSVNKSLPTGYSVAIVPSGNGSDMWNVTNQTQQQETFQETENPAAGQTTTVNYTGILYNPNGQAVAQGTVSVSWVNAWSGTVSLSANPLFLPTGNATSITAQTTQAVPSGYTLSIEDVSTGQIVQKSSSAPTTVPYTSYKAETDQFVAYVSDGYENVGNPSNTVNVVWSALSLGASPTQLPVNNSTAFTVSGQNVPSGDYLVIENQSTGQVVGYSQSTPYSVALSESTAQNDSFVAYISSSTTSSGAYATSNPVAVDWYSMTLTANPDRLPVGDTTTLTATAQSLPSGYVMDIVDQTTNQVIATGEPGQTTVQALQTKNQAETDHYIAQIAQPGNPLIPGLSVPVNTPTTGLFETTSSELYYYDSRVNQMVPIASAPILTGQTVPAQELGVGLTGTNLTVSSSSLANNTLVYDPDTQTLFVGLITQAYEPSGYQSPDYMTEGIWAYSLLTNTWTKTGSSYMTPIFGFGYVSYYLWQGHWDPVTHKPYFMYIENGMYNYDFFIETINPNDVTAPATQIQSAVAIPYYFTNHHTGRRETGYNYIWPLDSFTVDTQTGDIYSPGAGGGYYNTEESALAQGGLLHYSQSSNTTSVAKTGLPSNAGGDTLGDQVAYDPVNNTIYFTTSYWYPFYNPTPQLGYLYSYNLTTQKTKQLVQLPSDVAYYVFSKSDGNIYLSGNDQNLQYNPTTDTLVNIGGPTQIMQEAYDPQLQGDVFSTSSGVYLFKQGTWTQLSSMSTEAITYASGGAMAGLVKYFPYWNFTKAPGYVPTSLFTQQATADVHYPGYIWVDNGTPSPNGTAFFESTFNLSQAEPVTFNLSADDYAQVYVDGQPITQEGSSGGVGGSIPTASTTITLPAGNHQVIVEAMNNNAFTGSSPNYAGLGLTISSGGTTLLATSNASQWLTTGYVTQLPAGWFSGAVGTYNFTEYMMQENLSQPIYQQQAYTVQTTAQSVSAQTNPLPVTWFNPVIAPDNFNLEALPTNVTYPAQTQFKVTFDQSDINFVNQEFAGTAKVDIRAVQTWQVVASGTWTPNSQGMSIALPYKPVGGTTLQYVAFLVDPSKNVEVAVSNQVTVTDTGQGIAGNSYTTTSCSAQGNGTEIFDTYTNGKLTSTKTEPLTMQNLEVDGIYNPTQQLHNDLGTVIHLPVTNAQVGYGPIPLRVQAPFAFAIQFPDAQPTTVTATFHVIENDPVDVNGNTSWTVKMHPATNLPYGFWQGETIMPKLPDGDHISIQITATDPCGTATTPTGVAPYDDFVTTNGRPEWYFVQPSSP